MTRRYRRNVDFDAMSQDERLRLATDPSTPTRTLELLADWAKAFWKEHPSWEDMKKVYCIGEALASNPSSNIYVWCTAPYGGHFLDNMFRNMSFQMHLMTDPGLSALHHPGVTKEDSAKMISHLRQRISFSSWSKLKSYLDLIAKIKYDEIKVWVTDEELPLYCTKVCAMWEVAMRTTSMQVPSYFSRSGAWSPLGSTELDLLLLWSDGGVPEESARFLRSKAKSDSPFEPNRRRR